MGARFFGQSPIFKATNAGRAVLGIATEESLAVDAAADLAVDEFADLVVMQGVTWTGAASIQTIRCEGGGANTVARTDP